MIFCLRKYNLISLQTSNIEPPNERKSHSMSSSNSEDNNIQTRSNMHTTSDLQSSVPVNSVDTIKQIVKHLLKKKGRHEEPSEHEINQAMQEFQDMNKVPRSNLS